MKTRIAILALVVLGGMVSLGALLMSGGFLNTPSASATWECVPLIVKTGPNPEVDVEVVGEVCVQGSRANENVTVVFRGIDTNPLNADEVHACVGMNAIDGKLPPGNQLKCEAEGGHFGAAQCDPAMTECVVEIPWEKLGYPPCSASVVIQAHAAMADGPTAYGERWKGNFELYLHCCS